MLSLSAPAQSRSGGCSQVRLSTGALVRLYSRGDDRRTVRVTPLCMRSPPPARTQPSHVSVAKAEDPMAERRIGKVGMVRVRQPDLAMCKFRRTLSEFRTKRLGNLAQSTRCRVVTCSHEVSHLDDIRILHLVSTSIYHKLQSYANGLHVGSIWP